MFTQGCLGKRRAGSNQDSWRTVELMVRLQVREAPKEGPRGAASYSSSDCKGRGLAKPLGVDKGIKLEVRKNWAQILDLSLTTLVTFSSHITSLGLSDPNWEMGIILNNWLAVKIQSLT